MTAFLIGIDDTDAPDDRGTGFRARQLGQQLEALPDIKLVSVVRHQLLVDPRIPYTSHNSAACLWVEAPSNAQGALVAAGRDYLLGASAPAADPGLCVAPYDAITPEVVAFGELAQQAVTTMDAALTVAAAAGIHLEGLAGTRGGLIGALAAVGLRRQANSGRLLWLPGLRDLQGVVTVQELCTATGIDVVATEAGQQARAGDRVDLGDWARPILRHGRIVLLVERKESHGDESDSPDFDSADFEVAAKSTIKRYSE